MDTETVNVIFFNDTAPPEIYTLSLHDAIPISLITWRKRFRHVIRGLTPPARLARRSQRQQARRQVIEEDAQRHAEEHEQQRSEEHTSELQSRQYLVCRLLLEKKKNQYPLYLLL